MTEKEVVSLVADDLDDGLAYEFDVSDNENANVNDSDDESELNNNSTKHKTEQEENQGKKRKAKPSKLQDKKRMKMEMDIEQKKNLSLESSTEAIVEFLNNKVRQKNTDLSALELSELYFKKTDVRSTADFKESRNLDNLSKFIESKFKNMLPAGEKKNNKNKNKKPKKGKKDPVTPGSTSEEERKFIAILSMSALRACDIHRATREISGSSLKLINKNKIAVDLKLIKTTNSRVLCCTPGRLVKILNNDDSELKREEIKIIIMDNSYLDSKCQNIWDIQETNEVLKSLTEEENSKVYLY